MKILCIKWAKQIELTLIHWCLLWLSNESLSISSKNTGTRDVCNYMLQIKPKNNLEYLFRAVWSKTKLGLK